MLGHLPFKWLPETGEAKTSVSLTNMLKDYVETLA